MQARDQLARRHAAELQARGDLGVVEAVDIAQAEGLAGAAFDVLEAGMEGLPGLRQVIDFRRRLDREKIDDVGIETDPRHRDLAPRIERDAPDDAEHPPLEGRRGIEFGKAAEDHDRGILEHILGLLPIRDQTVDIGRDRRQGRGPQPSQLFVCGITGRRWIAQGIGQGI